MAKMIKRNGIIALLMVGLMLMWSCKKHHAPANPEISSFSAKPSSMPYSGGAVNLSWAATNATGFSVSSDPSLNGFPQNTNSNSLTATIPADTTSASESYIFTLQATGQAGTTPVKAKATVDIAAPHAPSISSFTAKPDSMTYSGGTDSLKWSASNATGYKITSSPSLSGLPATTTNSVLTVAIPANSGSSNITYTITLTANGPSGTTPATKTVAIFVPFQTSAPTVTTASSAAVTDSSATLGGDVTGNGNVTVSERGIVYSTSNKTPTTSDTKVTMGSGTGSFSQSVTGLSGSTTYYVRAYAINSVGTGYGAVINFTTPAALPQITSFTVSPDTVYSKGGTVKLAWSGKNVTGFNLSSSPDVFGFTQVFTTSSGNTTASIPSITGSSDKAYNFYLTATGTTPVKDTLVVTQRAEYHIFSGSNYGYNEPQGIAVDKSGNIWVANSNSVTEIPGGSASVSPVVFSGSSYGFNGFGLAVDGSNNVFVTNVNGHSVNEIPGGSASATPVVFSGSSYGFNLPIGIAVDGSGNIWVTNNTGNSVTEIPGGSASATPVVFSGGSYSFNGPQGIAVDGSGNIWVTNKAGNSVTEIPGGSASATPVVLSGSSYSFNGPDAIAVDGSGNIWVANYTGNSVIEIPGGSKTGAAVVFRGGSYSFSGPHAIAVDGSGNIWVANYQGNSVTEIPGGSASATPVVFSASRYGFNGPYKIAVDGSGNIFVTNVKGNSVTELIHVASSLAFHVPLGQ